MQDKPANSVFNVEYTHQQLLENREKLDYLINVRGWSEEIIRRRKIGWGQYTTVEDVDKKKNTTRQVSWMAYMIPVYEDNKLADVKVYNPFSRRDRKWRWLFKTGRAYAYPEDVLLNNQELILAEGELDQLLLESKGIAAVTFTGGSQNTPDYIYHKFIDKDLAISYDMDDAGASGAQEIAESLLPVVRDLKIVLIPFDLYERLRGLNDVTDFFMRKQGTIENFRELVDNAKRYGNRDKPLTEYDRFLIGIKGQSVEMKKLWVDEIHKLYHISKEQIMLDLDLPISRLKSVDEMIQSYQSYTNDDQSRVLTGFPWIDKRLRGGPAKGCVFGIAAASNVGKTILIENMIVNLVPRGYRGIFFSLEQESPQAFERMAAMSLRHTPEGIERIFKQRNQPLLIQRFKRQFGSNNFHICAEPDLTLADMENLIEDSKEYFGDSPHFVMIDYLDLIKHSGNNEYEKYGNIAKGLKVMAKRHKVVVFTPLQLNMAGFGASYQTNQTALFTFKPLDKSEIRYATGIFQHLDYCIGMARPDCTPGFRSLTPARQEDLMYKIYFNWLKNRDGTIDGVMRARLNTEDLRIIEEAHLETIFLRG